MGEVVIVTEREYVKGRAVFEAESRFGVQPASGDEKSLAEAVRLTGARAVIVGVERYEGLLYEALENSGGALIARFGVGHDGVDKERARKHGVFVTNTPGVLDSSVAELAMWMIGALLRGLGSCDSRMREGDFSSPSAGWEARSRLLAVIGFGAIGRRVASVAHQGFGMRVLAADIRSREELEKIENRSFEEIRAHYGLEDYTSDIDDVLGRADIVSLHLTATPETRHFMNARRLGLMKQDACLVNTSRGSLIDEAALYGALEGGRLAGAALDVYESEPYKPVAEGKDLRTLKNVFLTPHIGSNTREANERMARAALSNAGNFLAGHLDALNRVDR